VFPSVFSFYRLFSNLSLEFKLVLQQFNFKSLQKRQIGNLSVAAVTIKAMKKNKTLFSWRLTLIIVLGCLGGVAVTLFGRHVDSMSDLPLGPTPLSWTFKTSSAKVTATFSEKSNMIKKRVLAEPVLPEIDMVVPAETEQALFALG